MNGKQYSVVGGSAERAFATTAAARYDDALRKSLKMNPAPEGVVHQSRHASGRKRIVSYWKNIESGW
ncbi:MAG: hypothetical protein AAF902_10090 [Chloroflexota bacterium]